MKERPCSYDSNETCLCEKCAGPSCSIWRRENWTFEDDDHYIPNDDDEDEF